MATATLGLLVLSAALGGCVQRTMVITSEPSGALVYLNGQEVGRTPIRRDFTWYGDYDVRVRQEGFQTLKTHTPVKPPWWQVPPVDLFAELFPLRDVQRIHYDLEPVPEASSTPEALLERAERMRESLPK